MAQAELPDGVSRMWWSVLGADTLTVANARVISWISGNPDLGRVAHGELPFLFNRFILASKNSVATSSRVREFSVNSQTDGLGNQEQRRAEVKQLLEAPFTNSQAKKIANLLLSGASRSELADEIVNILSSRFLGTREGEVPSYVVQACLEPLSEPPSLVNTIGARRGRKANRVLEAYISDRVGSDSNVSDLMYCLTSGAQELCAALAALRYSTTPDEALFAACPVKKVFRVPTKRTTLNGLLPETQPLVPGRSVVVLDIGTAAKETGDDKFIFGAGINRRQCPFKAQFRSLADGVLRYYRSRSN